MQSKFYLKNVFIFFDQQEKTITIKARAQSIRIHDVSF